ncbi:MAG: radical SAM protein [Acutalibacteraceae bacterium]|nr:radical SAM protein [Acutalibacteraceae bacterium]
MERCNLCPRMCGAARGKVRGEGFCGCGRMPIIARAALHMWEEPVISGSCGSGTIFFSGCGLGCVFCQNDSISSSLRGSAVTAEKLAGIMRSLELQGAHNISFVTGTHYVDAIISALKIYRPGIPTVWNSGGYERLSTLRMLKEYIDIWLPDFKFALPDTAAKYASARDYPSVALEAIKFMCMTSGGNVIENGIMKRGVIVRHLVLPGNVRNSVAALRKISSELPRGTLVSIMSQYTPSGNISVFPELGRRLTEREYRRVLDTADALGIDGFKQELSSAAEEYVPEFDLTEPEEE